ncbi:DUF222 domain-containing protein, partial [Mycobacterium koreense]
FWRITLPHTESAMFEAALHSHADALHAEWKRTRDTNHPDNGDSNGGSGGGAAQAPMPTTIDAFMRLVETSWDSEVQRRPQGQRTTVVV